MPDMIFVYGTLRPALATGTMLKLITDLQRIGQATMPGRLYDLGPYPAAVLDEAGGGTIVGEVFQLPTNPAVLIQLDEHEEYLPSDPARSMYLRVRRAAKLKDGRSVEVWVYAYNRSVAGAILVTGGDYLAWRNR